MFIFFKDRIETFNPLKDKRNETAGTKSIRTGGWGRGKDGVPSWVSNPVKKEVVREEYSIRTNVWEYVVSGGTDRNFRHQLHPAPFPINIAKDHIITWTDPGDLVLDPMVGSGTTISASTELHRQSIGIEIHEEYFQDIRKRLFGVNVRLL